MNRQRLLAEKKRGGISDDYLPLRSHRDEPWCNNTVCVDQVMWNHQRLFWNGHWVATVVLGLKQINFKARL